MFGFIRPVKSELKVKEADRFQQVYCGLCHAIRARYGRFFTMFLCSCHRQRRDAEGTDRAPPLRRAPGDETGLRLAR